MHRARSLLLKATVAVGVLAALAACDAPGGALAPREHRPGPTPAMTTTDSSSTWKVNATTATVTGDGEFCRSGYQVAYREDGTPYCAPIE